MKTPVVSMLNLIPQKMRARILKGIAILTALGTPKKVETLPRQLWKLRNTGTC